ncbi:protein FAM124B isoform X2 [Megalobrama amblycephala]|uniref:protein FAM124B isoform X2 n=1 Tax=Megalobrama amblycephala TaxID=75352 RepID=UPI002013F583|nr:protein FAM124B isoform X2 [Megalobrama amblycephala]
MNSLLFASLRGRNTVTEGAECFMISDCSKMSCSSIDLMASPGQELLLVTMHLLTNPGDSLLLQHTLDRLLKWVRPGLRLFHVSERACPLHDYARANLCPVAGHPSHAVTIFLHESYGEERILRVLDFLQCPPWQYHHTESCGGREGGAHVSSTASPSSALLRPYLLPSRDFYSLGAGMPVWGVRPVHYGGEVVRVTLHSTYDNFEDTVRLYETVLQRRVEEQKTGFCWFTLLTEQGFNLQLAIKQLSPGVRVEPCYSAVLQFKVGEIGQLVPLLPNTCSPISATRWHTEDLDGNKILFQVKAPAQPQGFLTSAFPLSCPRMLLRNGATARPPSTSPCRKPSHLKEHPVGRSRVEPPPDRCPRGLRLASCGRESMGSDGTCSTPPGSSCYSSQRSSPACLSVNWYEPAITSETSISCLLLEEEEPETNVDTGCAVKPQPTLGVSALVTLSRDLKHGLAELQLTSEAETQASQCHSQHQHAQVDEFFI